MQRAAQLIEALLQFIIINAEPNGDPEQRIVIGGRGLERLAGLTEQRRFGGTALPARAHAENDVPQPQLFFACGLSKANPDWMRESFQSSVMPSR